MCAKHDERAPDGGKLFTGLIMDEPTARRIGVTSANTVLGPVDARLLGVTLVAESLMYVLPGAQYAYDIKIDRAEVFDRLEAKLQAFKAAGGGTIVDATGMFEGRDLRLYEALSRATGVHIIASTGQGPEAMLGGYYLTPQTNPPTPWPAQKFAELFGREVNEGMVVPRLERRARAGLVATAVTQTGATPTDASLVRGAARAASAYGVPMAVRCGANALTDLQLALDEEINVQRIVIRDLDRRDAVEKGWPQLIAAKGARVCIDHVGSNDPAYLSDIERVALIAELIEAGHAERILLSAGATGVAFGVPGNDLPYSQLLTHFVPLMREAGVAQSHIEQMLITNTAQLLSISGEQA